MAAGNTRLVEDLGNGNFRITPLGTLPTGQFFETVTNATRPLPADRPAGWMVFNSDDNAPNFRGFATPGDTESDPVWVAADGTII